ncbi:DUF2059 domain-containing protein [Longimicrobium sp.]|uniref:DUF2059 domain-containing protein n=1 Tax=Longimicrobium sp. TaxID=2029185 RepID=UPI002E306DCB|nr:DUF2059 domain-containing protein [Longimicrobium sp.]HEX6037375.1 DUF2059 domain-containing protein [Longimicrobium sp.]
MRITQILLAGSLAFIPAVAAAQPGNAPARPAEAAQVSDSELELATRLIQLADLQGTAMAGVKIMLDQQIQASPEMAPYRGVLEEWIMDVFKSPEATSSFAQIYAEAFTERELRDIVAFYQTPTGRRMAAEQGSLAAAGARVGEELAQANVADLMTRLGAAMAAGNDNRKQD